MPRVKVDFTGVENYQLVDEGLQPCVIKSFTSKLAQSGNDMLVGVFEVTKGESKGGKLFDNFVLTKEALFKLKALMEALGKRADGKVALDTEKLIGLKVKCSVIHEDYEGKTRAKIAGYEPYVMSGKPNPEPEPEEDDEDYEEEEEEEAPKPAPKAKPKAKPTPPPATKAKPKAKAAPEPEEDDEDGWADSDED